MEELGRHDKGAGSQGCPKCGGCKVEHVHFDCASYDSLRLDFLDYLKMVLPPDAFKTFLRGSIFDKTASCLGENRGMLVNTECSSRYNRVGDFWSQFGIGENSYMYCTRMDQHAWPDKTTPLHWSVWYISGGSRAFQVASESMACACDPNERAE